jgi:hypothetical protein
VIAFVDEINPGFRLERDPKNPLSIIQINEDGTRSNFITAKDNNDLLRQLEGRRSPSAFIALSKEQFDRAKVEEDLKIKRQELKMKGDYYARVAKDADAKTPEAKLKAIEKVIGRALTDDEKLIAVGLQVKDRPSAAATPKELDLASDMLGKPVMTADGKQRLDKDGKPVKHDLRSALESVLSVTRGKEGDKGLPGWGGKQTSPPAATPAAAPAAAPAGLNRQGPASLVNQTIGYFTPQSVIEQAARAGNTAAIAELDRRRVAAEQDISRRAEERLDPMSGLR